MGFIRLIISFVGFTRKAPRAAGGVGPYRLAVILRRRCHPERDEVKSKDLCRLRAVFLRLPALALLRPSPWAGVLDSPSPPKPHLKAKNGNDQNRSRFRKD